MQPLPSPPAAPPEPRARHLARLVLFVFLLTFIVSRVLVFLIMARLMPDLYLHMRGTHVHHLNYGIFGLCGVGAWLLFAPPRGRMRSLCAVLYAIGLALTFDEFGMWLHLGGDYWQRASFDAVTVVAAALGLLAFAPAPRDWRFKHVLATVVVGLALAAFGTLFVRTLQRHDVPERLHQLEEAAPQ
ncbi:MAG: hypothetical protein JSR26_00520 [Proteobacteria bacterium]|nr:hypothetical protein [Pseudomonadota bacterium]